jgi:acylphosphatase
MRVARRYLVSGRVQGVGFRFFAHEAASVEGVSGWVANLPDGRVEVWIEGDDESVSRVERKIRRGPPGARVSDVETLEETPTGRYEGFKIRQSSHE